MIIVDQLKLSIDRPEKDLRELLLKKLAIKDKEGLKYKIVKKSIDARKKPDIYYVYSVQLINPSNLPKRADLRNVRQVSDESYHFPYKRAEKINEEERPLIVGFGPAGIFCAYQLAKAGFAPIVLERGKDVDRRSEDVESFWRGNPINQESNVQFGEGGAGTFSDGKLNTSAGIHKSKAYEVLKTFATFGAPEEILYDNKPHIGTDLLKGIVKNIRQEIISLGGQVIFEARFESFIKDKKNNIVACLYRDLTNNQIKKIPCKAIALSLGHSARDTFRALNDSGIRMEAKPFAVGIRMEHPQSIIDAYMYGEEIAKVRLEKGLPAADYKLTAKTESGRGVYSFCMCPGGYVVNASSGTKALAINGMSYHDRNSDNANSAIIVTVDEDDFGKDIFAALEFQEKLEAKAFLAGQGLIPIQLYKDFKEKKVSKALGQVKPFTKGAYTFANLSEVLPSYVIDSIIEVMPTFAKRIKGFDRDDAICLAVESRTSSPVRMLRDKNFMAVDNPAIFPCGEGAGYAGGITSAAVDGIKVAEAIARFLN